MGGNDARSVVPSLVGLPVSVAHDKALDARFLAVDQDPSHTPSEPGTVTAQQPAPGNYLEQGRRIRIWVSGVDPDPGEGGGGGGNQPLPTEPVPVAPAGVK